MKRIILSLAIMFVFVSPAFSQEVKPMSFWSMPIQIDYMEATINNMETTITNMATKMAALEAQLADLSQNMQYGTLLHDARAFSTIYGIIAIDSFLWGDMQYYW